MNILSLPTASTLAGAEILYAVQNGVDVKLTPDQIKAYIGATVTANVNDGNRGDITVSANGATWKLNGFTTFGKTLGAAVDASAARTLLGFSAGSGGYQPYSTNLDAIAQLLSAANTFPFFTGSGTASLAPITAFGRSILDDADAAAVRTTIGAQASGEITAFARTLLDDATAEEARATLGVSGSGSGSGSGTNNTITGEDAGVVGGNSNVLDGNRSASLGGRFLSSRGINGLVAFGATAAAAGKRQGEFISLSARTTNATAIRMTTDGSGTASASNQIFIRNRSIIAVKGLICAIDINSLETKVWELEIALRRNSAGTTFFVGGGSIREIGADANTGSFAISVGADSAIGCLRVSASGQDLKTVDFHAALMCSYLELE